MSDANQQSNDKLDMQSPDLVQQNIEKLAELFPNCVTESVTGKEIDFDLLKQELNHAVVEGNKERYRIEWPGKREAIVTTNLPINKALRPVREESVDFDNTENIYIEGDNLEVLKLLQESYLGKIKMIYIDPPYNTGNDFIYNDSFSKSIDSELIQSGQKDNDAQRLVANPDSSGRYHSDWLSMIYPRLKLARNLLTDDGAIFISIDDNEQANLKKVCDEIFGEKNFVASFAWKKRTAKSDVPFGVSQDYEWILCFTKNRLQAGITFERKYYSSDDYPTDRWRLSDLTTQKIEADRPNSAFDLIDPKTQKVYPYNPKRLWGITKDTFDDYYKRGKIVFPDDYEFLNISIPSYRVFESEDRKKSLEKYGSEDAKKAASTFLPKEVGMSEDGNKEIFELFNSKIFSYPKPTSLLKYFLSIIDDPEAIVLDFFSGSASLADAVLQNNAERNESRKFLLVQLPEEVDVGSEAYKKGYRNICHIGQERIRRSAKKIKEETGADIDYGFRVYRLDDSNMKDVYYRPQDLDQSKMDLFGDNVKPDRTEDDLLAQVMLDWGLPLSLKIEQVSVAGKKVFKVADNSLFACFDNGLDETFAKEIAKEKPLRIVFKDAGFKDDTAKTNVKQMLKQLSPETEMKVL